MHDTPVQRYLFDSHPGYRDLSDAERIALNDFFLLWPVYEGSILGPRYTEEAFLAIPETLNALGLLGAETLATEISHFKQRYFRSGDFTQEFHGLHVERTTQANRQRIKEFLMSGPELSIVDALRGVLLIILRLRNNAFHGTKALYGYVGQLDNFTHANAVLLFFLQHYPNHLRRY